MIIVAARPGVGKSTLALDLCAPVIKNGKGRGDFLLEMAKSEIVMRILSAEADVKLSDMRSGRMTDQDWAKLRIGSTRSSIPLFILMIPPASLMMEIRSKSRANSSR